MTSIANALTSLGVTEWVLRGEPTNEEEFNTMFRKVTGADENGTGIESADPSDWGTTWKAVSDKKTELTTAEPMRLLRIERDRLLAECDWMANSDVTMSTAWRNYRQALRDITTQTPTDDALSNITFPTKPTE